MLKQIFDKLKYVVFLLIGVALMYYAFKDVDWGQMFHDLKKAKLFWVFLSMFLGIMAFVFRGVRWVILIEALGYKASRRNCTFAVTAGYFANLILPRMGEVTRCTALNQVEKVPLEKLLGTIVMERVLDLLILISLIGTTVILKYDQIYPLISELVGGKVNEPNETSVTKYFVLGGLALVGFVIFFFRKKIVALDIYKKIANILRGFGEGIVSVFYLKKKVAFLLHTFGIWLMYYLMTYVVIFAVKDTENLGLADGLFIMVMGGLGMLAPVQGGIGAYHLMVKITLAKLGIVEEINADGVVVRDPGLFFATILHTGQTLMTVIAGGLAIFMLYLAKRKKGGKQAQSHKIQNISA